MTKTTRSASRLAVAALAGLCAQAGHSDEMLARQAFGGGAEANEAAVRELRREGPAGVAALLAVEPAPDAASRPHWERALDAVCAQRDCAASGLFWHTDLDRARAEAESTHRPILSLRLLGRLDEEVSCANSRFFRTVLYPDPRVADRLRQRFVLHWESVRPVPRVTIDYGDGRVLRGTITGNSIHYVLDPRGRLVDALPGLYGPGLFLDLLGRAEESARRLGELDDRLYARALASLHREALVRRGRELANVGGLPAVLEQAPAGVDSDMARLAQRLTMAKAMTQMPLVNALSLGTESARPDPVPPEAGQRNTFDWPALAEHHREDWELSAESREMVTEKHRAATGTADPGTVDAFERLVGLDTVRNEYLLHTVLHLWLATSSISIPDLAEFNDKVYSDLFLTPSSDPWLGLMSPETYLALAPVDDQQMAIQ